MGQPLRVLHCLRAPVGGLFRHVLDLAAEQAALGHEVGLLACSTVHDRLTELRLDGIRAKLALGITRTAMARQPGPSDLGVVRFTTALAEKLGVDVLHGHGAKGGAYARLAGRILKRRGRAVSTFYTPHGGSLNFTAGTIESRIFLGMERFLHGYTDGLVFESAYAARVYGDRVCPSPARSRIVPNGLRPADFVDHRPAASAREFLFIGELRSIKGIDVLLRALAEVNKTRPAQATIVGSGPDGEKLKTLARELGLERQTTFPGALPARDAFPLGRILVVPSRAESFPYIVLEAGAAGIPLLTTGVGGIPEILAGTDTPMLTAGDAGQLARHMLQALDDGTEMQARAERLKAVVAERYTVAGMTQAILAFYADRRS